MGQAFLHCPWTFCPISGNRRKSNCGLLVPYKPKSWKTVEINSVHGFGNVRTQIFCFRCLISVYLREFNVKKLFQRRFVGKLPEIRRILFTLSVFAETVKDNAHIDYFQTVVLVYTRRTARRTNIPKTILQKVYQIKPLFIIFKMLNNFYIIKKYW